MAKLSLARMCYTLMAISMLLLFFAILFWIIGGVNDSFREEFVGTMLFAASGMILSVLLFIVMCCAQYGDRCLCCFVMCPALVSQASHRSVDRTADNTRESIETSVVRSSSSSWLDRPLPITTLRNSDTPNLDTSDDFMNSVQNDTQDFRNGIQELQIDSRERTCLNGSGYSARDGVPVDETAREIFDLTVIGYNHSNSVQRHDSRVVVNQYDQPPSYELVVCDEISEHAQDGLDESNNEMPPTYEEVTSISNVFLFT